MRNTVRKTWADGMRRELVIAPCIATYIEASQRNYAAEKRAIKDICNRYHQIVPYWADDKDEFHGPFLPYDPDRFYDLSEEVEDEEHKRVIRQYMVRTNKQMPAFPPRTSESAKRNQELTSVSSMPRKKKDERENAKGWADGMRRELIISPCISAYTDARQRGHVAERRAIKDICNRYHHVIPYWLKDEDEYYGPFLPYDPNKTYDPSEEAEDEEHKTVILEHVNWTNKRIRRLCKRLSQKVLKAQQASVDINKNPLAGLFLSLGGLSQRQRRRSAQQQFQHESSAILQPLYDAAWAKELADGKRTRSTKQTAPWRDGIVKKAFLQLSKAERDEYEKRAIADGKAARDELERLMKEGPLTTPEARARAIQALPAFLGNVMLGVEAYCGLQGAVILGGPMPTENGDLRVHLLASGKNLANDSWMDFDPEAVKTVKGLYLKYTGSAYGAEHCQKASLKGPELAASMLYKMPEDMSSDESSSDSDISSDDEASAAKTKRKRKRKQKKRKEASSSAKAAKPAEPKSSTPITPEQPTGHTSSSNKATTSSRTKASKPKSQGDFDVKRPAQTFRLGDPPGEREGYRRLLWEKHAYMERIKYAAGTPEMKNGRVLAWMENHYVDHEGRVRDRCMDSESEAATSDSDYEASDEEEGRKKKKKKTAVPSRKQAAQKKGPVIPEEGMSLDASIRSSLTLQLMLCGHIQYDPEIS
ncbi:hypothetical protein EV122DRAFT_256358 [Schizophyllum commune]